MRTLISAIGAGLVAIVLAVVAVYGVVNAQTSAPAHNPKDAANVVYGQ